MSAAPTERWTRLVTRVLAPNAGPMTLDGTNSLVMGEPGHGSVVVVDPGPDDEGHLERLRGFGTVELVLLTHHHVDHVEAAELFAAQTGASVRAFDPRLCIDAPPLIDGEQISAAGARIDVVATPGHTADSVSFHLPADGPSDGTNGAGTMITGDTILGRGTTTLGPEPGALRRYLDSLARLRGLGAATVLPAHGDPLPSLAAVCDDYLAHRRMRLGEIRAALDAIGRDASAEEVADVVYAEVDPVIRSAALASVRAQLDHLRDDG